MKKQLSIRKLWPIIFLLFSLIGCSSDNEDPDPVITPPKLPVTPPSPEIPNSISTVSEIKSGQKTGEVFLYGVLTSRKNDDDNEWFFTDDDVNEIVLDFPSSVVPPAGTKILVYGGVEDVGEVDVYKWEAEDDKPTAPVEPPVQPTPQPPSGIKITKISDILNDQVFGLVLVAGQLTEKSDDDCDEWMLDDGTGSIEADFSSCNVPDTGIPVYIYGYAKKRDREIDVMEWQYQSDFE